MLWKDFKAEHAAKILPGLKPRSRIEVGNAIKAFERHCNPVKVATINTR
jgi:hypothetical protein